MFVTLKTGRIYRLELSGQKITKEEILIDNKFGRLRDIVTSPDGFIYFSTDNNANSQILRIKPKE